MEQTEQGWTLCSILDPWHTGRIAKQYLLVPEDDKTWNETYAEQLIAGNKAMTLLRTPLRHMTLTTSCHVWLLSYLDALDHIAVICDTSYIASSDVQEWMRSKRTDLSPNVIDGGSAASPNTEVLLAAQCDALWISPFENISLGHLAQLPIPIIYCADYMETSPLGRAEWMRFYGRLFGKGSEADSLFATIANRYQLWAGKARNNRHQTLLAELPYGATWYVPGGRSSSALLYRDAGYDYLWSTDTHAGSLSLSREAVLAKAGSGEVWLFKYHDPTGDWSLTGFLQHDELYRQFQATSKGEVWGCNTAYSDFFDVTPFRPDTLLQSLVQRDSAFFKPLR